MEEPYWKQLKREQDKKNAEVRKSQPKLKDLFKWIDENGLHYQKLNEYQHRVKNLNTGKFVDWWDGKKKAMRRADETFGNQGDKQAFLLQEIVKLV